MRNLSVLWWGAHPMERDGGMIVQYYLCKKYYELFPLDGQYGVPKNPEELDSSVLPYITYLKGDKFGMWNEGGTIGGIAEHMTRFNIPVTVAFHIAEAIEPHVFPIHESGGYLILHQTVHWEDDSIFNCKVLPYVGHCVAPTEYAKEVLARVGKIPLKKLSVIPHGIPTETFYPHPSLLRQEWGIQNNPVILYCGRLDMWKGVQQLIPLVSKLIKEYNATFIIRGGVRQLEKSQNLDLIFTTMANKYGKNFIYLPDWQSPEFMAELMNACDIYVSPSGHEGFNVPLGEAMSNCKPVVTTKLANHDEIISGTGNEMLAIKPTVKVGEVNNGTPILVPSSERLYGALKWLLENPDERQARGLNGRKKVIEKYDLTNVAVAWKKLFHSLVPEGYDLQTEMAKRMLTT